MPERGVLEGNTSWKLTCVVQQRFTKVAAGRSSNVRVWSGSFIEIIYSNTVIQFLVAAAVSVSAYVVGIILSMLLCRSASQFKSHQQSYSNLRFDDWSIYGNDTYLRLISYWFEASTVVVQSVFRSSEADITITIVSSLLWEDVTT